MKYHIEKNTVQETLVIPLLGRLVCSEHFPELFSDPEAKRICDCLDYDFAEKRKKMESAAGLFLENHGWYVTFSKEMAARIALMYAECKRGKEKGTEI